MRAFPTGILGLLLLSSCSLSSPRLERLPAYDRGTALPGPEAPEVFFRDELESPIEGHFEFARLTMHGSGSREDFREVLLEAALPLRPDLLVLEYDPEARPSIGPYYGLRRIDGWRGRLYRRSDPP